MIFNERNLNNVYFKILTIFMNFRNFKNFKNCVCYVGFGMGWVFSGRAQSNRLGVVSVYFFFTGCPLLFSLLLKRDE